MSDNNRFLLKVITPERVFYDGEVSMVEFNTTEGEIGIYKNHIPTTVIVEPGILTITEEEGPKNAALHAGFAEILPDSVVILAEIVEWPSEIDLERAERAKERAEERISQKEDKTDMDRAHVALKKAICRINTLK
ncbi:MAG: ATP synthase F1 subunit epsilon [Lachnospiraceae bacterium]|nr:ATP synthase F1 subunit epsilon [Lachnospiraceae bacterium]